MKKRYFLLIVVILLLVVGFLFRGTASPDDIRIGFQEKTTDTSWQIRYLYLDTELTRTISIEKENQGCVLDYETNGGSYFLEIIDASGEVLETTVGQGSGSFIFLASSDLTIRIRAEGHSGSFTLTLRDDLDLMPFGT